MRGPLSPPSYTQPPIGGRVKCFLCVPIGVADVEGRSQGNERTREAGESQEEETVPPGS